jgi:hypothetical protein
MNGHRHFAQPASALGHDVFLAARFGGERQPAGPPEKGDNEGHFGGAALPGRLLKAAAGEQRGDRCGREKGFWPPTLIRG